MKSKLLFSVDGDTPLFPEFLDKMYSMQKSNGYVLMPDLLPQDDCDEKIMRCVLDTKSVPKKELRKIVSDYVLHVGVIAFCLKANNYKDALKIGYPADEKIIKENSETTDLYEKYLKFVKRSELELRDEAKIDALLEKQQNEEPFTAEEEAYYEEYREAVNKDAENRVGGIKPFDRLTVIYARRLISLVLLDAPQKIIRFEQCKAVAAFCLNKLCSSYSYDNP